MKVLMADDEPVSRRLLESLLHRWGYEVIVAKDGVEASAALLAPDSPKLAILDWLMPGIEGLQLCRDVRRIRPVPYTYIIMLTGKRNQGDIISGLDAGADDYVVKPFDPAELKVRLRTGKRILYLQDQLISAREALRDQATRDSLTGLWNRAAIMNILSTELARECRQGSSVGIAIADVDFFKRINDTHGHPIGDEVLRKIAQAMRESVRRYDSVGRIGGEEFVVVFPGCDAVNVVSHAERLRAAVSRIVVETPRGNVSPTVSFGVVVASQQSSPEACDAIQAADEALYRAKQGGRNRVELATSVELLPSA